MFPLWRLVLEKVATFGELRGGAWSIDDVGDANDALDFMADQQAARNAAQREAAKANR